MLINACKAGTPIISPDRVGKPARLLTLPTILQVSVSLNALEPLMSMVITWCAMRLVHWPHILHKMIPGLVLTHALQVLLLTLLQEDAWTCAQKFNMDFITPPASIEYACICALRTSMDTGLQKLVLILALMAPMGRIRRTHVSIYVPRALMLTNFCICVS